MLPADLYRAIFNSFHDSPGVSLARDRQHRTAIESKGLTERFFIAINMLTDNVVARQRENFFHREGLNRYLVSESRIFSCASLCSLNRF